VRKRPQFLDVCRLGFLWALQPGERVAERRVQTLERGLVLMQHRRRLLEQAHGLVVAARVDEETAFDERAHRHRRIRRLGCVRVHQREVAILASQRDACGELMSAREIG